MGYWHLQCYFLAIELPCFDNLWLLSYLLYSHIYSESPLMFILFYPMSHGVQCYFPGLCATGISDAVSSLSCNLGEEYLGNYVQGLYAYCFYTV